MVQKNVQKAPISFRASDYTIATLETISRDMGLTRTELILMFINQGIKSLPDVDLSTKYRVSYEIIENKTDILIKNMEKFTDLTEIERKMHNISDILMNLDQKKEQKSTFYFYITDVKKLLFEIADVNLDSFGKCKEILKKNTNKRIFGAIFTNDRQMRFPEL